MSEKPKKESKPLKEGKTKGNVKPSNDGKVGARPPAPQPSSSDD